MTSYIELYNNTIKGRNGTVLIPCLERLRSNESLTDDNYHKLRNMVVRIEEQIGDLQNVEDLQEEDMPASPYASEEAIYHALRPLNAHFSPPEIIHFMLLFEIGKQIDIIWCNLCLP